MTYNFIVGVIGDYINYPIAFYFLIIMITAEWRYKIHAFIIFMFSSAAIYTGLGIDEAVRNVTLNEYIKDVKISILWDGAAALMLTMFLIFDKAAWKQALLLAFAVLCHSVLIYDLTITSSPFSNFFYDWYDELIIAVGLLQMGASYNAIANGFAESSREKPRIVLWLYSLCGRGIQSLHIYYRKEKSEKRS